MAKTGFHLMILAIHFKTKTRHASGTGSLRNAGTVYWHEILLTYTMNKVNLTKLLAIPFLVFLMAMASCGRLKSNHPQTGSGNSEALENESAIRHYADSIDGIEGQLDKQQSLIYTRGDSSFFVTRYSSNGIPLRYIKNSDSNEHGETRESYYLNNKQLVLYTRRHVSPLTDSISFRKDYYRNNVLFYSEMAQNAENEQAAGNAFHKAYPVENANAVADIRQLDAALNQTGKFNLVFEEVTEYPKACYLVLTRDEVNAYRAALLLEKDDMDEFAKELISNPRRFKGRKLNLKWKIRNAEEAVYISGKPERK